jgi:hypothetical protein
VAGRKQPRMECLLGQEMLIKGLQQQTLSSEAKLRAFEFPLLMPPYDFVVR